MPKKKPVKEEKDKEEAFKPIGREEAEKGVREAIEKARERTEGLLVTEKVARGGIVGAEVKGRAEKEKAPPIKTQEQERQERIAETLRKQKKKVEITPEGEIITEEAGRKVIITRAGQVIKAPPSARVDVSRAREMTEQRARAEEKRKEALQKLRKREVKKMPVAAIGEKDFVELAERPFGEAQRVTISELKKRQDLYKVEVEDKYDRFITPGRPVMDTRDLGIHPVLTTVLLPKEKEKESPFKRFQRAVDITISKREEEAKELAAFVRQQKRIGKFDLEARKAQAAAGLIFVGTRTLKGFVSPFVHPVETVKGFYTLVRHPIQTGEAIIKEAREEPIGFIAETIGTLGAFRIIGAGVKKGAKVVKGKVAVRKADGFVEVLVKGKEPATYELTVPSGKGGLRIGIIPKDYVPPEPSAIMVLPKGAELAAYTYPAAGAFAAEPSIYEPPAYLKVKKKEAIIRSEEQILKEVQAGRRSLTEVPSKIRKKVRQEILARRSISPLMVEPAGVFAKELPLYEPPELLKVRARERAREQVLKEVERGERGLLEVRKDIRREIRKKLISQAESIFIIKGKPFPKDLLVDIDILPIPIVEKVPKKTRPTLKELFPRREPKKEIKKARKEIEKPTETGQILILKEPEVEKVIPAAEFQRMMLDTKQMQKLRQEQKAISKAKQKAILEQRAELAQKAKPKVSIFAILPPKTKVAAIAKQEARAAQKAKQKAKQIIIPAQDIIQVQEVSPKEDILPAQDIFQDIKAKTKAAQKVFFLEKRIPRARAKEVTKEIARPRSPFDIIPGKKEEEPKKRFTAEVRREGVFREVGGFETPGAAFREAKRRVSETAAASLRVTGPSGVVKEQRGILSSKQFYRSKKEPGVYIEKKEERIKTRGELGEITFKGLAALRSRRAGKNSQGNKKGVFDIFG